MHRNLLESLSAIGATLALCGCSSTEPPALPADDRLAKGMAEAVIDTGFYTEVAITALLGNHYNAAEDVWKVLACFDFITPAGGAGTNCVDSFRAFRLDNGRWIVGVTINEAYRWRTIDPEPEPGSESAVPATPAGG